MAAAPVIAVASPSFSRHPILRAELLARFPSSYFNESPSRLTGQELCNFLSQADGAVIGLETIDLALLEACPRLRIIAKYGVGLDNLDLEACYDRTVDVGWTPGSNRRSVAELTICFMLGLCRNVFATANALRSGAWKKHGGRELSSATVGLIGLGHIGKDVANLLQAFGCRVQANDIADLSAYAREHNIQLASKEEIYRTSDVVSLHVPLTPETRHLINAAALAQFLPHAFLVNTARGAVVDTSALVAALREKRLGGAALDVFEVEPPQAEASELLAMPNVVGTAHIGGNSAEAILALGRAAIDHLSRSSARLWDNLGDNP